ncbi:MAG: nucleotidyltransferase [Minisyncoccia bacterium]
MAINEEKLKIWSNAPPSTKTQFTHSEIRKALEKSDALKGVNYEVYLQGSYANSTNTKIDSDVDVVVQLNSTFSPDTSKLSLTDKQAFNQAYPTNATYLWSHFHRDVLNALTSYFGSTSVKAGTKSIKILGNASRVNADVVPCLQHKSFSSFNTWNPHDFVEGIKFWTNDALSKEIINFPRIHITNGEAKNHTSRTQEKYKHLVRIIKNIRRQLVENHSFDPKVAPSYFVECIVYNVPDVHFQNNYKEGLEYVINHILNECTPQNMVTVSHQHILFGTEPWQWNQADASIFFNAVNDYYLNN